MMVLLVMLLDAPRLAVAMDLALPFRAAENMLAACSFWKNARRRQGRRSAHPRAAPFAFAGCFPGFGKAAADSRVIDRGGLFQVRTQDSVGAAEEGVVATFTDRIQVLGTGAVGGRDQVDAAARSSAILYPFGLPLVDVLALIGISRDERFLRLEESPPTVGAEVVDDGKRAERLVMARPG